MASITEEDLSCPVCHDIYKYPVVLSCSHSFCKDCLKKWWREKRTQECPFCNRRSSRSEPTLNLILKNLCESFTLRKNQTPSAESKTLCKLHSEKLKLFCVTHQQPVCLICRDSKAHINHKFRPIEEVAQDRKKKLQKSLKPLHEKLKHFEQVKRNFDQTAEYITVQTQHTESQIKEQFKKFYQFLQEEEQARISVLKEEEKKRTQMIKEKIEVLSREIEALSAVIRATEEELGTQDVSFLQNYTAIVKKVQQRPQLDDPQLVSGALMDVAAHLGNLRYNMLERLEEMVSYTPVILDPNSAHPELTLSEDLTSVICGEGQMLPKNPERFVYHPSVLGSEGFDSGTHSWDVDVGESTDWSVGVAAESVKRKGNIKSKLWRIKFSDGKYKACSPSAHPIVISGKTNKDKKQKETKEMKIQLIRIHLDRDKGKLSFVEPNTQTLIHTFTCAFTEKLFPYICNKDKFLIRILPEKDDVDGKN